MTVKAKARKATAADIDPIFAAINEHNALIRESDRLEKSYNTARDKAEKSMGNGTWKTYINGPVKQSPHRFTIDGTAPKRLSVKLLREWPG
jgi:hypothetical protein